jgi:hypothetical protein
MDELRYIRIAPYIRQCYISRSLVVSKRVNCELTSDDVLYIPPIGKDSRQVKSGSRVAQRSLDVVIACLSQRFLRGDEEGGHEAEPLECLFTVLEAVSGSHVPHLYPKITMGEPRSGTEHASPMNRRISL